MQLFLGAVLSGLIVGLTFAMIGFSASILYRSNGVLSFAQPMIATFLAFIAYFLVRDFGFGAWATAAAMLPIAAVGGTALYWVVFRINDSFGNFNAVMRTIALFLLIQQFIAYNWSQGEPFGFPRMADGQAVTLPLDLRVSPQSLVVLAAMCILLGAVLFLFTRTRTGLLLRSVADSPANASVIGIRTRRLSAVSWGLAAVICAVVAVVNAPDTLVSTEMFSPYVLLAFTALLIGGLNSWMGAILGGVLTGLANSLLLVYTNTEIATLTVFGLLLVVLIVKPNGLLGSATAERF